MDHVVKDHSDHMPSTVESPVDLHFQRTKKSILVYSAMSNAASLVGHLKPHIMHYYAA